MAKKKNRYQVIFAQVNESKIAVLFTRRMVL